MLKLALRAWVVLRLVQLLSTFICNFNNRIVFFSCLSITDLLFTIALKMPVDFNLLVRFLGH